MWYAAYGSNCDERRLATYLLGGRLAATGVDHPGSVDPAPPLADVPWTFDRPLRFAGHSDAWGGATAELAEGSGRALGRAWLLSWRQLEDVLAQENGTAHHPVSLAQARSGARVHPGGYGRLLLVGSRERRPVVTFTAADPRARPPAAPSRAYLGTIVRGLRAVHHLDPDELVEWLLTAAGVDLRWDRPALRRLVDDEAGA